MLSMRVQLALVLCTAAAATACLTPSALAARPASRSITCPQKIHTVVNQLSAIETSIDAGTTWTTLHTKIATVGVLARHITVAQSSLSCGRNVMLPSLQAITKLATSLAIHDQCAVTGCDANHEAQIQRAWTQAEASIDRAARNLT